MCVIVAKKIVVKVTNLEKVYIKCYMYVVMALHVENYTRKKHI